MSFKVLKSVGPILVSLSIMASSGQVESMKIDVNFIVDIIRKAAEFDAKKFYEEFGREGFDAGKAFQEDFDYLNEEVFNGGLFCSYKEMDEFDQYLEVHTLRKFFDCNESIKKSFKFVHEKIPELRFLLYDFEEGDDFHDNIKKAVKGNNINVSELTSRKLVEKNITELAGGRSSFFDYLGALGLSCEAWCRCRRRTSLCGTSAKVDDLVKKEIRNQLGEDSVCKLKQQLFWGGEFEGILSMMFYTLHEIAHHVGRYLGALERLCGVAKSNEPINMLSGINRQNSLFFSAYSKKNTKRIFKLLDKLAAKEKINEIKAYVESLGYEFKSKLSLRKLVEELKSEANNRKAGYKHFGHTEYGATCAEEDLVESIALSMMPCCVDLAGPEALRECLNAYADKLLSIYKQP